MLKDITFAYAEMADIESVAQAHVLAFQETYVDMLSENYLKSLSIQDKTDFWRHYLTYPSPFALVVAKSENEVIGFCSCGPSTTYNEAHSEVSMLYILQAFQGQGVGSKLLKLALSHLSQQSILPAWLKVARQNHKAIDFYEHHGFHFLKEGTICIEGQSLLEDRYIYMA